MILELSHILNPIKNLNPIAIHHLQNTLFHQQVGEYSWAPNRHLSCLPRKLIFLIFSTQDILIPTTQLHTTIPLRPPPSPAY